MANLNCLLIGRARVPPNWLNYKKLMKAGHLQLPVCLFSRINHEDVCMAIALTGFDFGERLGTAFKDNVCATFKERSLRPGGPVELFRENAQT